MNYIRILFLLWGCIPRADGSVQLTRFHTGHTYTLTCSSLSGSQSFDWYWNTERVIRTFTTHPCRLESPSNHNYTTYLSGRVNVSCDVLQHNVTLRINSTVDDGSQWQCEDVNGERSNSITIDTSPTDTPPTDQPEGSTLSKTSDVVYAVGAGVGVVIIAVFVVIVVCVRRKKGRQLRTVNEVDNVTDHLAPTPTYYNVDSGILVQQDTETVLVENDIYQSSTDVTSSSQPKENYHVVTDVYAQVQKPKKTKMADTVEAEYVNIKDLHAKPDKSKTGKKQ